eukprot:1625355-Amphidinium_carterae.1
MHYGLSHLQGATNIKTKVVKDTQVLSQLFRLVPMTNGDFVLLWAIAYCLCQNCASMVAKQLCVMFACQLPGNQATLLHVELQKRSGNLGEGSWTFVRCLVCVCVSLSKGHVVVQRVRHSTPHGALPP